MTVVLHRFPEVRRIRASILRTRIARIDYAHFLYALWPGRNSATAHRKPSRKGEQQKSRRQQHLRKSLTGQIQGESQQTKPPCLAPIGNGQIRRRARYDRRRTVLHISPDVFPIPVKLFFYRPRQRKTECLDHGHAIIGENMSAYIPCLNAKRSITPAQGEKNLIPWNGQHGPI